MRSIKFGQTKYHKEKVQTNLEVITPIKSLRLQISSKLKQETTKQKIISRKKQKQKPMKKLGVLTSKVMHA